jgi:hypothetical protein
VREKLRRAELLVGAERHQGKRNPVRVVATKEQHRREKQLAAQAEQRSEQRWINRWRHRPRLHARPVRQSGRKTQGAGTGDAGARR